MVTIYGTPSRHHHCKSSAQRFMCPTPKPRKPWRLYMSTCECHEYYSSVVKYKVHLAPSPPLPADHTHAHSPVTNPNPPPQPTNCPTTHRRLMVHPYTRVRFRKTIHPAANYTPNVEFLQARCVAEGSDPAAIGFLRNIFADGISVNALTRRMTRDEAREHNCGAPGLMFRVLLRTDEDNMFHCRLCAVGADKGGWKQAKDALRHLKRDHFGLGVRCHRWSVLLY
jgi:hypothetical protein